VAIAPVGRKMSEFLMESQKYGWPSFRDDEINWDNVAVIEETREIVTLDGVHLGHYCTDEEGNRYNINLSCISGKPP
jgi:hypothetical protein